MENITAVFTKDFQLGEKSFKCGDTIVLQETTDIQFQPKTLDCQCGIYWVVNDGEVTRDLITNNFGTIFRIVTSKQMAA